MNVSRTGSFLLRVLAVSMPLGLPCCVAPSSKTAPGEVRPVVDPLSIGPERRAISLQEEEEGQDGPAEKRSGPFITRMKVFTNYYPKVEINGNKVRGQPIQVAQLDQSQPSELWWNYSPNDDGTITIGAARGIITSVLNARTSKGAYIVLERYDAPGDVRFVVRDGDQNGLVVHEGALTPERQIGDDYCRLVNMGGGAWILEIMHAKKRVELPVGYLP